MQKPQPQDNEIPQMINIEEERRPENSDTSNEDEMAFKKKLDKLKMMKEAGVLSEEELQEQKQQLLKML